MEGGACTFANPVAASSAAELKSAVCDSSGTEASDASTEVSCTGSSGCRYFATDSPGSVNTGGPAGASQRSRSGLRFGRSHRDSRRDCDSRGATGLADGCDASDCSPERGRYLEIDSPGRTAKDARLSVESRA